LCYPWLLITYKTHRSTLTLTRARDQSGTLDLRLALTILAVTLSLINDLMFENTDKDKDLRLEDKDKDKDLCSEDKKKDNDL